MRSFNFISILLILFSFNLSAQNYEQQGDELFAQAQYEKACKKYSAAIEMMGGSSRVSQKLNKSKQCQSSFYQAQQAEQENNWSQAASVYTYLYELHPLSTYKSKADSYNQKILFKQQQEEKARKDAEEAERHRIEQIALEEQKRKAAAEAQRKQAEAARAEQRRREEEEANKRNITFSVSPSSGVRIVQYNSKGSVIKEGNNSTTFRVTKNNSYRFRFSHSEYKTLDTTIYLGSSDQRYIIRLRSLLEKGSKDISIRDLILYPLAIKRLSWTDSKSTIKKYVKEQYPSASTDDDKLRYTSFNRTYYNQGITEFWLWMDGKTWYGHYKFSVASNLKKLFLDQLRKDLNSYGFSMPNFDSEQKSTCYKDHVIDGICFRWMIIEQDKGYIKLNFAINRDESHKSTSSSTSSSYTSSTSSYSSSSSSSSGSTYRPSSSSSNSSSSGFNINNAQGSGILGSSSSNSRSSSYNSNSSSSSSTAGYIKLKDLCTEQYMYISDIKILKNNTITKRAEVKFISKQEGHLPITYIAVVKKGDIGVKQFEFTGDPIASAIPEWLNSTEDKDYYIFPVHGNCKIDKNWDYELGDIVLIKTK